MELSKLISILQEAEKKEKENEHTDSKGGKGDDNLLDYDKLASLIVEKTQKSNINHNQGKEKPQAESLEDKIRRLL